MFWGFFQPLAVRICLFFNYGEGWIDIITKDKQLVEAFLRKPPSDKYFNLKQALIHINILDNWLLEKDIDFDPTPNYMKTPKLIKKGTIDIKKRDINWQDFKINETKQYEITSYIFAIVRNYQFEIDRVLERFQD